MTAFAHAQSALPASKKPKQPEAGMSPPSKKQRVVVEDLVGWNASGGRSIPMEIIGDNQLVIDWLNGTAAVKCPPYIARTTEIVN